MKKAVLCLGAVFVAVLGPAWAETLVKRFDVSPGGLLTVKAERSSVVVLPSAGGTSEIEITSGLSLEELEKNFSISVRQAGNQILVEADCLRDFGGWFGGWNRGRGLRITAPVPREFNVDLKTSGAVFRWRNWSARCRPRPLGAEFRQGGSRDQ